MSDDQKKTGETHAITAWRIDVFPADQRCDSQGRTAMAMLADAGIGGITRVATGAVFLIELAGERDSAERVARELLANPVTERVRVLRAGELPPAEAGTAVFEVHPRPGVTDPIAASTRAAIADLGIIAPSVRTGRRFVIRPVPARELRARIIRTLGNDCIEEVIEGGKPAGRPPLPVEREFIVRRIELRALDDNRLAKLSRDGHLFLSVEEMRTIRGHFQVLGRDPTDLELETLAQTWSEHCVHKTLKSAVVYRGAPMPGECGMKRSDSARHVRPPSEDSVEIRYDNLLRDTIARATQELMQEGRGPECLSVFKDNAGIIAFDDQYGIAFKAETHNRPSAIEPYGGAATGVGGVIRDVLGCGLGAKPIANTDVFCVAPPNWPMDRLPKGVIHPKRVLRGVVAGVRDYGNRMGIPTVNGAVHFDPRYLGNPLVFCGCVGLIPRDRIEKAARPGDLVVVVGGRTGRDGIHGATFSSAELTDSHAEEFSHAVQIGNAIEEKKVLDVILQARDRAEGCLYTAITDCGAGGLSSAVGEMAADIGAEVDLDRVPLKYDGLRYDEIWISESQERMVLAVPPENVAQLQALFAAENVEAAVIGRFTDTKRLVVRYRGTVVGELDCHFLHDGLPKTERVAEWWAQEKLETSKRRNVETESESTARASSATDARGNRDDKPTQPASSIPHSASSSPAVSPGRLADPPRGEAGIPHSPPIGRDLIAELKRRLSHPTIASKEWIVRQYDHEVQGRSVIKPLVGARQDGPGDAAVIRPRLDSNRGIAIGCGLCPQLSDIDPYWMAVAAIDEAIRNVVCVGGDPSRTAILDNFCWGRTDDPRTMGALVRACQGCYDAAKGYGVPFISGKDSLNNEFVLDAADVEMVKDTLRTLGSAHDSLGPAEEPGTAHPANLIRNGRIAIPGTLLISAVSIVDDVTQCITMDLKQAASQLFLVGQPTCFSTQPFGDRPAFDFATAIRTHQFIAAAIRDALIVSAHDVCDGGLLTACAEMCIAGDRGCRIHGLGDWSEESDAMSRSPHLRGGGSETTAEFCFAESPALYVVEARNARVDEFARRVASAPSLLLGTGASEFGFENGDGLQSVALSELREAWQSPLHW